MDNSMIYYDNSALDVTEDMSVSDLNVTRELDKTDVIAKMAFPRQMALDDSQHFITDNLDTSLTLDLQSNTSTQLVRGFAGQSSHSKLSRALR
jgi:hypothetical protein